MKVRDSILDTALCTYAHLRQLEESSALMLCKYGNAIFVSPIFTIRKPYDFYVDYEDKGLIIEIHDLDEMMPIEITEGADNAR